MNSADSFSDTYSEARSKFLALLGAADARGHHRHPLRGPAGEELFTDVAWFGERTAPKVIVLISGTHGVEGFCGSGAQIDLLRRRELANLPPDVAVLVIHAINPYGFAWLRRVNEDNVDLNRNWVDFRDPPPPNAAYARLHPTICPDIWTGETADAGDAAMAAYAADYGPDKLRQAIGGGQWDHPNGLYYGGSGPTWSRLTQTAILTEWLDRAEHVGIIDYHTGLGPRGFAEPISTAPPDSAEFRRARNWFGATVKTTADGTSIGGRIQGDGLSGALALLTGAQVTAIALEVGTHPRPKILRALRADAWLHAHGDPTGPEAAAIQRELRDCYFVDAPDWKGMVAGQALAAWRQALGGLTQAH